MQQSHQGEGADEDEEQSSVPQQIPVRRGVRVAHPGGRSRAAGRGRHRRRGSPQSRARGPGGGGHKTDWQSGGGGLLGAKFPAGVAGIGGNRASPAPGQRAGQGWLQGARLRPGLPSTAFTSTRQCPASADFPARGSARAPSAGRPLPRRWRPMRSGDRAVRPCALERRAPPPLVGPDRGYPARCRLRRARSDPRSPIPAAREREGGLRSCGWEVGDRAPGQSGCWAVQRGRREPGLKSRIKKGAGKEREAELRRRARWRGTFACGAPGTESPHGLASSGRFLRRMRSKVSRAALQGHARGSCMLMAPGAPLLRGGNPGALASSPSQLQLLAVHQRPCCHRDTGTLSRRWNHS